MSEIDGAPDAEPLLVVEDLTVGFPTEDGVVHAVRGVSYELRRGEVLGIVGESGSGKSVSTMALLGLLPKTAPHHGFGAVPRPGAARAARQGRSRSIRGKRIAMIFQDPMTSLNPVYTVGYQLAEAVRAHHDVSMKDGQAAGRRDARPRRHPAGPHPCSTRTRTSSPAACASGR